MSLFQYENQGSNTYLVYEVSQNKILDTMSLGMLINNKILGLAPTRFTQMDEKKYLKYNVTAKVSAKQFFSGTVNKKRLIGVFRGIVDAMLSAEDYMIENKNIILDLDYIFSDVSSCDTVMICLPLISDDLSKQDLGTFFKNIMFTTQFDQTETCDHVAKIINFLNGSPMFSLVDFKELLDSINKTQNNAPQIELAQQSVIRAVPLQSVAQPPVQSDSQQVKQPKVDSPESHSISQQQMPTPDSQSSPVEIASNPDEPHMSWLYLMQHYNKENAELYKAQKSAKKSHTQQTTKSQPRVQTKQPQAQTSYAVPGAPVNVGFAVPGQPLPITATSQQPTVQQKATQTKVPVFASAVQQSVLVQPSTPQSKPMYFGETTVLGEESIGETIVLNADSQQRQAITPYLIRCKNNDKIMIDKPVYRIGKEKSYVDYFIGDNTAISRSHANIVMRDEKYYIVDTNSTNHIYVDEFMIQSNSEVEISHGTKIRLANEDFIFNL